MGRTGKKFDLKSSSNMILVIALVLATAVFASLLAERHYFRWDLTSTAEHTLSEKTLQVLKNVKDPVVIKAFVREGYREAEDAERLVSAYSYRNGRISFEIIDPERHPSLARKYDIKNINTFILESRGNSQTVKIADEQHMTNALVRLISKEVKKVYWLTGHGERVFTGSEPESMSLLKEQLEKENYKFEELNLMTGEVPEDASLVVVAAPVKPLFPEESASLGKYIRAGGRAIVFLEPFRDGGLEDMLASYGITISRDIVVDKMSRVMGGDYLLPMVANYGSHPLTRDFRLTSLFSVARSVEPRETAERGVKATALAYTSPQSWSETDTRALDAGKVGLDENDRQGPVSLAVIAELTPAPGREENAGDSGDGDMENISGEGKLVVFGDADFAGNRLIEQAGNRDFINNTINYLVGRGDLITIKKKHRPMEPLTLTQTQGRVVFWIPVVIMPLAILILGMAVWFRRRSR